MELTIAELLELIEGMPGDTPVRMAQQPSWPFEYSIGDPVIVETEDGPVLYLPERQQTRYLPAEVSVELGWSE
jgi:hypothetical protein